VIRVLFVCLGNICRSPMAEGIVRDLVKARGLQDAIHVDSAGTHAYHVGHAPDVRAQQTLARRAIDIGGLKGRQVTPDDIAHFDYVLAMDEDNLLHLRAFPGGEGSHVRLFLDFAPPGSGYEVPDPYYGGADGFEHVYGLLRGAAEGLLADIEARL